MTTCCNATDLDQLTVNEISRAEILARLHSLNARYLSTAADLLQGVAMDLHVAVMQIAETIPACVDGLLGATGNQAVRAPHVATQGLASESAVDIQGSHGDAGEGEQGPAKGKARSKPVFCLTTPPPLPACPCGEGCEVRLVSNEGNAAATECGRLLVCGKRGRPNPKYREDWAEPARHVDTGGAMRAWINGQCVVVARVVLGAFERPGGTHEKVQYLNLIRSDCRLINLRWISRGQPTPPAEFSISDHENLGLPEGVDPDDLTTCEDLAIVCDHRDAGGFEGREAPESPAKTEDATDEALRLPRPPSGRHGGCKHILGFPGYIVNAAGKVFSCRVGPDLYCGEWQEVKPRPTDSGYLIVRLRRSGKRVRRSVARLILEAFFRRAKHGEIASHINNNKADNRIGNLAWKRGAEVSRAA